MTLRGARPAGRWRWPGSGAAHDHLARPVLGQRLREVRHWSQGATEELETDASSPCASGSPGSSSLVLNCPSQ